MEMGAQTSRGIIWGCCCKAGSCRAECAPERGFQIKEIATDRDNIIKPVRASSRNQLGKLRQSLEFPNELSLWGTPGSKSHCRWFYIMGQTTGSSVGGGSASCCHQEQLFYCSLHLHRVRGLAHLTQKGGHCETNMLGSKSGSFEIGKPRLNLGHTFWSQSAIKRHRRRKPLLLSACPPTLESSSVLLLRHLWAGMRSSFFRALT